METFCLVLTDRLDTDDAATRSKLADAFGMDERGFRERIWQRTPLVIRRDLGAEAAAAHAARLAALGATCEIAPDEPVLLWLRREGCTRGPLPGSTLERFARPGDLWCRDGDGTWQAWQTSPPATPPPLPASVAPPPLPAPMKPRRGGHLLAWLGGIALLVLLFVFWPHRGHPSPAAGTTITYVPRPLHPLDPPPAPRCAHHGAAPTSDEDRFLVTGGQRALTGRSQRNGGTYVAEATSHGADCADTTVQLYLFRDGGFIGPATPAALNAGSAGFASFELVDPEHLHYVVAKGAEQAAAATSILLKRAQGWIIRAGPAAAAPAPAERPHA